MGVSFELDKIYTMLRYGGLAHYPLLETVPAALRAEMIKRICYSRAHGFCYVRVPKAANSTITKTLAEHMDLADRLGADPRGQKAKKALRGLPSPANYAAAYRFTFVREPRSRVLSAWADKGHQPAWIARYRMGARDAPTQPAPFAQWLELLRDGLLLRNPHWAPQATILPAQGRDFDFIGRVETLDTDLPRVMEQIFGRYRGTTNREVRRTHADQRLAELVGERERRLIFKLYEEDYDRFYSDLQV